jgi:hypothetical protein
MHGHGRKKYQFNIGRVSAMKRKECCKCGIIAFLVVVFAGIVAIYGQDVLLQQQVITDKTRPVSEAADIIQRLSINPVVTYEDPILEWVQDMGEVQSIGSEMRVIPRAQSFRMPKYPQGTKLDSAQLQNIVDAYHDQTNGPKFKIISSTIGLHIIPESIRGGNGLLKQAEVPLDTVIDIPVAKRTPQAHMLAICEAVTAASKSGIILKAHCPWINQYFAPRNAISRTATDSELEKIAFEWGTVKSRARDAIIDLYEYSSSTLSWRVYCEAAGKLCVLNMATVSVPTQIPDGRIINMVVSHNREDVRKR